MSTRPWWKRPLSGWIGHRAIAEMQALGADVAALSDKVGVLPSKVDLAEIQREVKALRDDLLKPTIEMTVGNPHDKEL